VDAALGLVIGTSEVEADVDMAKLPVPITYSTFELLRIPGGRQLGIHGRTALALLTAVVLDLRL